MRPAALLAFLVTTAAWSGQVTLKIAVDRRGAVDDLAGKSGRFTSPESLDAVHRLRRISDAVLVGVSTVARDDPSLTVRRVEADAQPLRVVIDPEGRAPPEATLFSDGERTVVFSRARTSPVVEPLEGAGPAALPGVLDTLEATYGVRHLMVEGGPATARAFLEAELVDRAIIVRAPMAFAQPVPSGLAPAMLRAAGLRFVGRRDVGGDDTHFWTRGGLDPLWGELLPG
mmetsp:Transcript_20740/g.61896  ORF Transcript_20740/g.61896 Transcript_20740/m.61896 type:complete len:229 (+) Transcript_20740:318-1004(+)